eukprot:1436087-Rhodomonas_salina.1
MESPPSVPWPPQGRGHGSRSSIHQGDRLEDPEIGGHVRGLREREEEGGYWRVRSEGGVEWLVGGPGRRAEGREGGVEGGLRKERATGV